MFTFFSNCHTLFHRVYKKLTFPPAVHKDSNFSTLLPTLVMFLFFSYNDVRWYLIIVLIWISLIISCSEHLFMCLLAMCIFFFWSNFYTSLLLFLKWICCCWVLGLLYMFWILIPYQICDLLIFSPIMWVDFYSVDSGFRFTFETFLSSPIVYFFFVLCFWCYFQEIIAKSNVVKLLFYIFF